MKENITIKDVAIEAGVSVGTVDRVIHKRGRFSSDTEIKVNKAIKKLDYQPSQIASALVNMKKHLRIGISYVGSTDNEFTREIVSGITAAQNELEPFGVELVVSSTESMTSEAQRDAISVLVNESVDGIITLPFNNNSMDMSLAHYIPDTIPFATVTNTTWGQGQLFHIGPDDAAMGALQARLVSCYSSSANIAVLAPSYDLESTQKRVSGFVNKINTELTKLNLLQICPVFGQRTEDLSANLAAKTESLISSFPDIDVIYVTNGFIAPIAEKIIELKSNVKVFGHEYCTHLPEYMEKNVVIASLYQKTAMQWYIAIKNMYRYLTSNQTLPTDSLSEVNIIIKETLPFTKFGVFEHY